MRGRRAGYAGPHAAPSASEPLEQGGEHAALLLCRSLRRRAGLPPWHLTRCLLAAEHAHIGVTGCGLRLRVHVALVDLLGSLAALLVRTGRIACDESPYGAA